MWTFGNTQDFFPMEFEELTDGDANLERPVLKAAIGVEDKANSIT